LRSVVLAALNNVFPIVERGRWSQRSRSDCSMASASLAPLQDLGLPAGSPRCRSRVSTAALNWGSLRSSRCFSRRLCPIDLGVPAPCARRRLDGHRGIAGIWLVERAFDVSLFAALAAG
jgi:hypothetical protein